jgi:hypothetical protein
MLRQVHLGSVKFGRPLDLETLCRGHRVDMYRLTHYVGPRSLWETC